MKQGKCRTCEYGEVYNDAWCRCQHPVIKGCRVKISGGCEVEKLEKVREEYMKIKNYEMPVKGDGKDDLL